MKSRDLCTLTDLAPPGYKNTPYTATQFYKVFPTVIFTDSRLATPPILNKKTWLLDEQYRIVIHFFPGGIIFLFIYLSQISLFNVELAIVKRIPDP